MAQRKRVLAAFFWLLASLSILLGGVTVWAQQTLLTSDGWGNLVGEVASDPEVIDGVSTVLVDRLSDALDVEKRVAEAVPGPLDIVATTITARVQEEVAKIVAGFAATDAFQAAFVEVNKAAHAAAMRAIRGGDSAALTSQDGVIAINIFPLVEGVLRSLQDAGLIGADRDIPDLTDFQPSADRVAALESALGRDLPDDIGTITLIDSENLSVVQDAIRWFDLITIVMVLLAIVSAALALWLSERRIRMVMWLAVGAIAALLTGRVLVRLLLEIITRRQEEAGAGVFVSTLVDAAVDSLMWFSFILIAIAGLVAIVAWFLERRETGERASVETPLRTLGHWVRQNMAAVLVVGLALILVVALWGIGGADVALITAAAAGLLLVGVKVLADQDDDPPTSTEAPPTADEQAEA